MAATSTAPALVHGDQRPLVDITPFAVDPPQLGGQVVIRAVNGALARAGHSVEQFSMGIRKSDLPYLGRARLLELEPGYREHRRTEPFSALLFMACAALRLPFLWAGRALTLRPWTLLEQSVTSCRAVLVEMPWAFSAGRLRPPPGAPLIYVAQNAEYKLADGWRGRWAGIGSRLADYADQLEAQVVSRADLIFAITADDGAAICQRYKVVAGRVPVVPRGLDLRKYAPLDIERRRQLRRQLGIGDEFVVVFAGSRHPPNEAAARLSFDLGRALGHDYRVIVAGSVARNFSAAAEWPAWLRAGDPAPYLQAADLAINPMLSGSGMNVKMLEYLAWGLPVLTTPWGARGVQGQDGQHFRTVAPEQMPGVIRQLAKNPAARMSLGTAGRSLMEQRYSAEASARDYLALIADWQADGGKPRQTRDFADPR